MDDSGVDRERFEAYVRRLAKSVGHADRRWPLEAYLTGLLLSGERKSVEPMAAKVDPRHVSRAHQSMHHFVATAPWEEGALLEVARDYALTQLERHAPVGAWVVDDTGIPKKGGHSVGVERQYCGALGKTANCQVGVCVSLANRTMSVPAAWRLFLPKSWAEDPGRREKAGVPEGIEYREKWRIALEEIDRLLAEDLPPAPVVADSGYGDNTAFRDGLASRGLSYAMEIRGGTTVWPPGKGPLAPKAWTGQGRPASRVRRDAHHQPVTAKALAMEGLPETAWQPVGWREGTKGRMRSRFAAVRVRPAHRDQLRAEPRPVEWLLVEWPEEEPEPVKYWLSTVPAEVEIGELVSLAKIRWRVERDFQELKDELGLDHYEGRGWRGFHHHGVLCIAAYCFLAAERGRLSPLSLLPSSSPLRYPEVSSLGALPVRGERHNPHSITSQRMRHARALITRLPGCPVCGTEAGHFMTQ